MALSVKQGTFVLASTDSGTKQVRGVGFQGKALLLWAGNSPLADETWASDLRFSFGFADDAGSVSNVACFDEDGAASQNTGRFGGNDMILRGVKASGANVVLGFALGFSAWDADGFDLTVSTAPVANMLIHYLVLGGSDITKARKFEFTPAVAASQDVTVEAGAGKPDLVFTTSPGLASVGSTPSNAGGLAFSVFNKAIERAALMLSGQDGTATMQGVSYLNAKAVTTPAAAALDSIGDIDVLINWPTDGVRFLWEDTSAAATRTVFGLALYGTFQSRVGLASSPTSAGNQDLDAGFPPLASLFFTDHLPTHTTLDSTHADGHGMSLGAYDGAAQGLVAVQMDDSAADQTAKTLVSNADVVRLTGPVAGANPTNKGIAVASHTGNNVRLAWTTPDATARRFAWVALGSSAATTTPQGAADSGTVSALVTLDTYSTLVDAGTANEALALAVAASRVDSGAATETSGLVLASSVADAFVLSGELAVASQLALLAVADSFALFEETPAIQDLTFKAVTEALLLSEAALLGLSFSRADALTLTEALGISTALSATEPLAGTELSGLLGLLSGNDVAGLAELTAAGETAFKIAVDTLLFSEALALQQQQDVVDAFAVAEIRGLSAAVQATQDGDLAEVVGVAAAVTATDSNLALETTILGVTQLLLASDGFSVVDFAALNTQNRVKVLAAAVTAAVTILGGMQAHATRGTQAAKGGFTGTMEAE
jgi:hypothetical protein